MKIEHRVFDFRVRRHMRMERFENPNPDVERSDAVRISGGTARALQ